MQTKSRNFKDHEIRGILPDGSIYLKTGVKRKKYNDDLSDEDMDHINQQLIHAERLSESLKLLFGTSMDDAKEEN